MRTGLASVCMLLVAVQGGLALASNASGSEQPPAPEPPPAPAQPPSTVEVKTTTPPERDSDIGDYLLDEIAGHQRETWRWERLMGKSPTRTTNSAARSNLPSYRRWVRNLWKRRASQTRRQAQNPPHRRQWLCIQSHEGRWNDPNPPYWGGLQMDLSFQRSYGPELLRSKGTADRWTPVEQMWVAERAHRSGRGFTPWANTARSCALL
jgi:hypothetical protein